MAALSLKLLQINKKSCPQQLDLNHNTCVFLSALNCPTDDYYLLKFLRAAKFDYDKAYQRLLNYYTFRAKNWDIYTVRDMITLSFLSASVSKLSRNWNISETHSSLRWLRPIYHWSQSRKQYCNHTRIENEHWSRQCWCYDRSPLSLIFEEQ